MSHTNQALKAEKAVTKIDTKITSSSVVTKPMSSASVNVPPEVMNEEYARPEVLMGSTYKIKTPLSDHALYITINDTVLNQGTIHEERRPFEIFINSKNMDHFQWIVALTRVISAVFRKGGDCAFLVEELKAVFDPKGGYFKPGGRFMPSLVADIGESIETHLKMIGLLHETKLDKHQQAFIDVKRKQLDGKQKNSQTNGDPAFPDGAELCNKCMVKASIRMDGCMTCLNCGDSKCQ